MSHIASEPTGASADSPTKLLGIVLGLVVVLTLMLLAFATPALNSGPDDLPLAVSGPDKGVSRVAGALEKQSPGTFDVTTYHSTEDAEEAIRDREAVGGISVGSSGVTIQTASGAGASYAQLLEGVGSGLEKSGQEVTYSEMAPTTDDDPSSMGVSTLGMPLVFGGMATAALLLLGYRGPTGARLAGAAALALLGGFTVAAILQFGFGVFDGPYWQIALAVATGIFAISSVVLGLGTLLGAPGIALGAVTMLFIANPLSGLASGPEWLPQPWGEIGQNLPVGAAGSLIRSVAYFDGGGALGPVIVIAVWIVVGLVLAAVGEGRRRRGVAAV